MSATFFRAKPVEPADAAKLFAHAAAFDTELSRNSRAIRLGGYIVGAAGCVIGLCGIAAVLVMLPLKQTVVQFIPFNGESGLVGQSVLAKDAPAMLFRDQQARSDLQKFVTAAETWVADAADLNFHVLAVMATKDVQTAFSQHFSPSNLASPRVLYGNKATVRVERFRFTPLPRTVRGSQVFQVRFDRTEYVNGAAGAPKPWIATVTFAWHPDIIGTEADRAINLTGFQCTSYEAGPA